MTCKAISCHLLQQRRHETIEESGLTDLEEKECDDGSFTWFKTCIISSAGNLLIRLEDMLEDQEVCNGSRGFPSLAKMRFSVRLGHTPDEEITVDEHLV